MCRKKRKKKPETNGEQETFEKMKKKRLNKNRITNVSKVKTSIIDEFNTVGLIYTI